MGRSPVKHIGRRLAEGWKKARALLTPPAVELFEETGIRVETVGQEVAEREFVMQLPDGECVTAEERFFVVRVSRPRSFARRLERRRNRSHDRASLVVNRGTNGYQRCGLSRYTVGHSYSLTRQPWCTLVRIRVRLRQSRRHEFQRG